MAGKSVKEVKNASVCSENLNAVEVASAESILSSQYGSPYENRDGALAIMETVSDDLLKENPCIDFSKENSDSKHQVFLEVIRNKLISDFSSAIFRSHLESQIDKMDSIQINDERLSVIEEILVQIYLLSDPEKLLLYLKLPNSLNSSADPLTEPLNPFGNKQEIQQAIVWIKTHLEEDKEKSVLKQNVYNQYLKYCQRGKMKALSITEFGKLMKLLYPEVRPRRFGTRANSRYYYSGMGNTVRLPTPSLPESINEPIAASTCGKNDQDSAPPEIDRKKIIKTYHRRLGKPRKSFKIPSATVVKDPASENSTPSHVKNLTIGNEALIDPVIEQDASGDLKSGSEDQENLNKSFDDCGDTNHELQDLDISLDFVNEVTIGSDVTEDSANLNLQNEVLNGEGPDVIDLNKSNEVNSAQNIETDESQLNSFVVTELPLGTLRSIVPITTQESLNSQESPRFQGALSPSSSQTLETHRLCSLPQLQRCHRAGYVPIRPKLVDDGNHQLYLQLDLENNTNEITDLHELEEEIIKYFGQSQDSELLAAVDGGTVVEKLLKLQKVSETILKRRTNVEEPRSQSSLQNRLGTHTPMQYAVQEGLPQRSQSSVEYSSESTVTFQEQGSIEYVPNHQLVLLNTEELNTQNNTAVDSRYENVSVSPSTNYFHFVPISPGPITPMISPDNLIPQNAQTLPNSDFRSLNNNFVPSNNVLPPRYNFLSSNNTSLPQNNINFNNFNVVNPIILKGNFNVQNVVPERNFSTPMLDNNPTTNSENSHSLNVPKNSTEGISVDQLLPNEGNSSQETVENLSESKNSDFLNLTAELQELLTNHPNIDTGTGNSTSQSEPLNSVTDQEILLLNNDNCNNNTLDQYLKVSTDQLDFENNSFQPISNCDTTEPLFRDEPFPDISLDDLAFDIDDSNNEMFYDNLISGPDVVFDDNSLNSFPDKIDESNVLQNSSANENMDPFFEAVDQPLNQLDLLLKPYAEDDDFLDNFFYDSTENTRDPMLGTHTPAPMDEFISYNEPPASEISSHEDNIDDTVKEYLNLE